MKRTVILIGMIMIHSFSWAQTMNIDFNKEIDMLTQAQFDEHTKTLNATQATEAAFEFEAKFRQPRPSRSLVFFPIRVKPKPPIKPKTKVAQMTVSKQKVDLVEWIRSQSM